MQDNKSSFSMSIYWVLWLPVLLPLTAILASFLFGAWSWGLMDDINLVMIPGTIWQRFLHMPFGFGHDGRLQPVYTAHAAIFYHLFEKHPQAFYIFRWCEVLATLGVWGRVTVLLTRRWWAALLFAAVTLSFQNFYGAFFFLSLQEILGVFFVGLALLVYFSFDGKGLETSRLTWSRQIAIGLCLALAVLSKETFVACPMALGLTWLVCAWRPPLDRVCLMRGLVFFCVPLGFAIFLKFFISSGYSSDYAMGDMSRLTGDLWQWLRQVAPYHIVGLMICAVAFFYKTGEPLAYRRESMILGAFLYVLYLMVILPWSATGHYVLPLGVFAAFLITVFSAPKLAMCAPRMIAGVVLLLSVVTAGVGAKALYHHQTYQYDTANLLEWMRDNVLFQLELHGGSIVRSNADEPSVTIPLSANYLHKTAFSAFQFSPKVSDVVSDPQTRYYLWGPFWGDQDLRRLGAGKQLWYPVFTSKHWMMFRRAY